MNRGSSALTSRPDSRGTRFNEAPIHESGKSGSRMKWRPGPRSFNEAPIHESGKYTIPEMDFPANGRLQ